MKRWTIAVIIMLLILSCKNTQERKENEFFVFEPDIRLFTNYAFMNAAGYSHEWNSTMHPIRIEVREYLDSVLTDEYKKKLSSYYEMIGGGDFYGYGVYAINSGMPPEFGLICDSSLKEGLNKFEGLDSLLKEFYQKAKIAGLWDLYYPRLLEINLQYKPFAELAIKQITDYCRIDSNYFRDKTDGKFHYQQFPLMSYFTAFFHETGSDYWVVSGPSAGVPGPGAFYHEPLHKIINPMVDSYPELNMKINELVPLSQEKLEGDYNEISSLICESFVRTIDRILSARYNKLESEELRKMIEDEYRLGHILSFYLLEKLPSYEEGNKSLKEFYPELISSIDINHERERWMVYWKSQQKAQ